MTRSRLVAVAIADLGAWCSGLDWADIPPGPRDRLLLAVFDLLGVEAAGLRLPESGRLLAAWDPPPGPAALVGAGRCTTPDTAAWLNGYAAVSLELDEGNKYARGHPAAHGFPAVLAAAASAGSDGPTVCAALLVAYEVASRFGRATRLTAGAHPHGNWGVAGAAAGVARLMGLDASQTAAAIDAGTGLAVAGSFESALAGNPVRNAWIGASNASGLVAARMAAAGVATNTGTAADTLGGLLGSFDESELVGELGGRYDVTQNYYKRHASCSFTHPAADAVLALRAQNPDVSAERIDAVDVETHSLGAALTRQLWPTRLAAMFSTPYVVAAALTHDALRPDAFADAARSDPSLRRIAERVTVRVADDLDRRLPHERSARVTFLLTDGRRLVREVPNPVGDAAFYPFSWTEIHAKIDDLLGVGNLLAGRIHAVVTGLERTADVPALLTELAGRAQP